MKRVLVLVLLVLALVGLAAWLARQPRKPEPCNDSSIPYSFDAPADCRSAQ